LSPAAPAVIVQVSGDGKWLASGDKHGRVTLWNLGEDENQMQTLRKPWLSHPVAHLEFSSDSRWLFSASNDTNKYRYFGALWKLDQQPFSPDGFRLNANVTAFRSGNFAPGGRWFVTGHDGASWIWDLEAPDPSKKPVTVRRNPLQKDNDVELADGVWKLHRDGDAVTISRKKDPKATD
jgi:WD40 repeat protein